MSDLGYIDSFGNKWDVVKGVRWRKHPNVSGCISVVCMCCDETIGVFNDDGSVAFPSLNGMHGKEAVQHVRNLIKDGDIDIA